MAAWSEMSTGARGGVVIAIGAAVAAVIYGMVMPARMAVPEAEIAAVVPEAPVAAVASLAVAPKLDVVRIGRDGEVTIAGRAGGGDTLRFDLDRAEVARTQASSSGDFVGLFNIPASNRARILSVIALAADGSTQAVKVAIAPFSAASEGEAVVAVAAPAETAETQAPPAALVIDPAGVRVVSTAPVPAEVAANVRIESISYAEDGAVVLGGRGTAGNDLQVYLDQALVASTVIGPLGDWSVALRGVAAGLYTLRVDQLGADGKVVSRFETPFQRETLKALAAAASVVETAAAPAALDAAPSGVSASVPSGQTQPQTEAAPQLDVAVSAPDLAAPATLAEPLGAGSAVAQTAVSITVQPGFTLWGIAKQEFGDGYMYVQVLNANKERIKNPDLIYPGQVFVLPGSP